MNTRGTEYRIFGPPGTGKTTTVSRLVTQACKEYGSEYVLAASFTRTAARELVQRDLPMNDEQIGTLHALCYRQLDRPKIITRTHLKDWNAEHPQWRFDGAGASDIDDPYGDIEANGQQDGDRILQEYHRLRGLLVPPEEWPIKIQWFAERWTDFKTQTGLIDFTDLIEQCWRERTEIPNGAAVFFLDEVQDFSPLELALARHWGEQCDRVYLCGDEDQCQPGESLVRATCGDVPIKALDPTLHRLVSYDRTKSILVGQKEGYAFQKSERFYQGRMMTVKTTVTAGAQCTPNHRWLVRWHETAKHPSVHVVYLMQQDARFRIGWCRLFRADGCFHLGTRARLESADAAWILRVCTNRSEASLWESILSTRYGIPTIPFREVVGATHYTAAGIDFIFSKLSDLRTNAVQCLIDHGRDLAFPIWTPQQAFARRGGTSIIEIEACNLLSEFMCVPVVDGRRTVWHPITITEMPFHGTVYSLAVEPYHLYITHGLVTHNCLYRFKGAIPDTFLSPELPPEQVQVLDQSYRVPRTVHAAAVRWIDQVTHRMPKAYRPRDEDGEVGGLNITYKYLLPLKNQLDEWMDQGKTIAFLASCSFFLDPLKHQLRAWGIPFWNPYRKKRGDWNPLTGRAGTISATERLLSYRKLIDAGEWWSYRDLWQWASTLEADSVFSRGAKTAMRKKAEDAQMAKVAVATDDLDAWMPGEEAADAATKGDVAWLQAHLLSTYDKPMRYACSIFEARGLSALRETPRVSIGTIHSYKGGESQIVVLFPDLSPAGFREWSTPGECHDSVRRTYYVGMTRAKEALYWAQPCGLSIGGYL